jgi:hypothetical protein
MDYLKRTFKEPGDYEEMSISVDQVVVDQMAEASKWAMDNNRNHVGAILCFLRNLRDAGYDLSNLNKDDSG